MRAIRPRAVQRHLALPPWTLRESLRSVQDVALLELVELSSRLETSITQAIMIVGRTSIDASERNGIGVLLLKLVALREDGSMRSASATRGLRARLAFAQAEIRPGCRSLPV